MKAVIAKVMRQGKNGRVGGGGRHHTAVTCCVEGQRLRGNAEVVPVYYMSYTIRVIK